MTELDQALERLNEAQLELDRCQWSETAERDREEAERDFNMAETKVQELQARTGDRSTTEEDGQ